MKFNKLQRKNIDFLLVFNKKLFTILQKYAIIYIRKGNLSKQLAGGSSMKLTITGRKFTVTDQITEKINGKLAKFDKYFVGEDLSGNVVLRSRKNMEIIEITIYYRGTMFRAEVEDESIFNALDRAVDIIERQIRKNKTKLEKRLKIGEFDKIALADNQWNDVEEDEIKIVKTKKFVLKPMTPEEAILQMNLLDHEFFIFANEKTGGVCAVYKRKDGEYGLIESEIE